MRFLVDIPISPHVAVWLRSKGHDAVHLIEIDQPKMPDDEIFALAIREQRIVLTEDLDFPELASRAGRAGASIVVFRMKPLHTASAIQRLERVLPATGAALDAGAIVVIEAARHRVRPLPERS